LVFPVADILSRRGIPFLFATGLGAGEPMTVATLAHALGCALRAHRQT
jgi:hypothetical protein